MNKIVKYLYLRFLMPQENEEDVENMVNAFDRSGILFEWEGAKIFYDRYKTSDNETRSISCY